MLPASHPRSYIEEEFADGPQNGVFARDPDLREFVVSTHLQSVCVFLAPARRVGVSSHIVNFEKHWRAVSGIQACHRIRAPYPARFRTHPRPVYLPRPYALQLGMHVYQCTLHREVNVCQALPHSRVSFGNVWSHRPSVQSTSRHRELDHAGIREGLGHGIPEADRSSRTMQPTAAITVSQRTCSARRAR